MRARDPADDTDIVRVVLRLCVAEAGMPMDIARRIDRAIRDQLGGKKHYIRRAPPRIVIERDRVHRS